MEETDKKLEKTERDKIERMRNKTGVKRQEKVIEQNRERKMKIK